MKKNIVIEKSFKYNTNKIGIDIPDHYQYNSLLGFWINQNTGKPMVFDTNSPRNRTKKADIETGEDSKGE